MAHSTFLTPTFTVEVQGAGEIVTDRFGNERVAAGDWEPVKVTGWSLFDSQESHGDSILRTVTKLKVHFPQDQTPNAGQKVKLPDGTVWNVEATPTDYNHGPFGWQPGLRTAICEKVEG